MSHVATLIPAYKPDYLGELFAGLRNQTFKDFRVILSDDSPGARITELIHQGSFSSQLQGLDILVVRGPCSPLKNHQHVLAIWAQSTPLVHLLMDDDVIYPDFYREHVALHATPGVAVSVSPRGLPRPSGEPFCTLPVPDFITGSDRRVVRVDRTQLVASTVARCENWLGELSNMVFSARAALRFPAPPVQGVSYFGLPDIGLLLNSASEGELVFLRDHLSGFRQHPGQTTADTQSVNLQIAFVAWIAFALQAHRDGQLDGAATVRAIAIAAGRCKHHYAGVAGMQALFAAVRDHLSDLSRFEPAFGDFWQRLLASCPDTRPSPAVAGEQLPAGALSSGVKLVLVDDIFPNLIASSRVAEYNACLERLPAARVLSSAPDFAEQHAAYGLLYPQLAPRVLPVDASALIGCDLAHVNLLDNADRFLPRFEQHAIAFALTLYPGGGFGIGAPDSEAKLKRVLSSPLLKLLITTEPITTDYVREFAASRRLSLPRLQEIRGVVIDPLYFSEEAAAHASWFGRGKTTLDICFVAEKCMPLGVNTGYPEFIAAAQALSDVPHIRWHVVGGFTPQDIDVRALGQRIRFHGRLEAPKLRALFSRMDLCISLSRPGSLQNGNFDGFPIASAVEASLCGVAVLASDILSQNPGYVDGESVLLVDLRVKEIERQVRALLAAPERIGAIACAGQALSRRLYASERQIAPRIAALLDAAERFARAPQAA
jgi:glycosyltransferase involved in cell wall biosynthesis